MNCSDELADILLQILHEAEPRIRIAGNTEDHDLWLAEYNHLDKVSHLHRRFGQRQIEHYLDYAQGAYAFALQGRGLSYSVYEPLWEQLARYAQQHTV